jgi:hypothetical protein
LHMRLCPYRVICQPKWGRAMSDWQLCRDREWSETLDWNGPCGRVGFARTADPCGVSRRRQAWLDRRRLRTHRRQFGYSPRSRDRRGSGRGSRWRCATRSRAMEHQRRRTHTSNQAPAAGEDARARPQTWIRPQLRAVSSAIEAACCRPDCQERSSVRS